MSIMPTGGWNAPREGQIVPSDAGTKPQVVVVHSESRPPSAFNAGFAGCLGIICAIIFVLICLGIIVNLLTATPARPATHTTTETITVSAAALDAAYAANEPAADEKYVGKTLRVFGTINSIDKGPTGAVHIVMAGLPAEFEGGSPFGVDATMNQDSTTTYIAPRLVHWQNVTMLCSTIQRIVGTVMLSNCEFDLSTASPATPKYPEPPASEYNY